MSAELFHLEIDSDSVIVENDGIKIRGSEVFISAGENKTRVTVHIDNIMSVKEGVVVEFFNGPEGITGLLGIDLTKEGDFVKIRGQNNCDYGIYFIGQDNGTKWEYLWRMAR